MADGELDLGAGFDVLHGGDLFGLVDGAAVAVDEVGEGGLRGGVGVEAVDEDAVEKVAGEEERLVLADELGGGEFEVGDFGVVRGGEGDHQDLTEDDVLDLGRGTAGCHGGDWWRSVVVFGDGRLEIGEDFHGSGGAKGDWGLGFRGIGCRLCRGQPKNNLMKMSNKNASR